jgi:hypothetical protein
MSTLHVLNWHGDEHVSWNPEALDKGDPVAVAAVREAERIFAQELKRGGVAFRVKPGATAERIDALDPRADEIVVLPPIAGG